MDTTKIKTEDILEEILLRENYVTKKDIQKARHYAETTKNSLEEALLNLSIVTRTLLGKAVAESYLTTFTDLKTATAQPDTVLRIPESIARQYGLVLCKEDTKSVTVATDNPRIEKGMARLLQEIFPGKKITLTYAFPEDIQNCFVYYQKPLTTQFQEILIREKRAAPALIKEVINHALIHHASDIHFEPHEGKIIIRFRIDGVLHEVGILPKDVHEYILNRIKVLSHMRTDEHFSAQDGSMRFSKEKEGVVDIRVSVVPTMDGEKIALRLLAEYVRAFTFVDLGISEKNQTAIMRAMHKPFGMVLVTGPTGSGKTTTLYAILKLLNREEVNITTIEDPIEYKIPGINQIQVNLQTNLTFAKGLRSIIRQDPNIILVGEIRDLETAEIATNAALTGHLLFSTFHATDSATAIIRLLEMGIEPFLLASTLEMVVSQRLVRKICEQCKTTDTTGKSSKAYYIGKGCVSCGNTGYKGRTALFEYIEITPELEELILKRPTAQQIWTAAQKQGSTSLFEDGMEKVKNGITTLSELMRVAQKPRV